MRTALSRHARWAGAAAALALAASLPLVAAGEKIDYEAITKIKQQGLDPAKSQVMEIASWLTDVYGPRLTGSPEAQKAADWAVTQMKGWGLQNVAIEPWTDRRDFQRGWSNEKFYMQAISPQPFPIPGTPVGWTPGTKGLVRGDAILVTETTEADLQKYAGKLNGKWLLIDPPPDVAAFWTPQATRETAEDLQKIELATPPAPEFGLPQPAGRGQRGGGRGFGPNAFDRFQFFAAQGALGTLATTPRGHGVYTIGGNRTADPMKNLAQIAIPAEQYDRIARILAKKLPVTIEADIKNTFVNAPAMFNIVGEIPGTDKADEVVMLGAHFDSWHASTGATDNAAGSAAMLEAMRILKQSGLKMRRTVRIGLWTGEEQGLLGSREYVGAHYGKCNDAPPPPGQRGGFGRGCQTGFTLKGEQAKFAAYFNIDNGTGAIRGVYLQGNDAVASIFREWMEPFRGLGMTTLTIRNTGGTDHQSFDAVGLPGFQFIQDEVEYGTLTHHTNLDSYERLQPADMMKNATIAASFAYLAANRDEQLPRKPLPAPAASGESR